jgi:hypothetical protein
MSLKRLIPLLAISVALGGIAQAQQVYKWTDASGRVHYSQQKPEDAVGAQALDIAPTPPADPSNAAADAEIARINALSEQMARERQAAEQARQEQAIRDLEQQNKALENTLLNQQVQQQQQQQSDDGDRVIIGYPPIYPYPPYPPYPPGPPPYPPHRPPCQPWPDCRKPIPLPAPMPLPAPTPAPRPPAPLAKPNPPFKPAPAGVAPETQGVFRGR